MGKVSGKLTVFFEEPFWVGVFERVAENMIDRRCGMKNENLVIKPKARTDGQYIK